MSDYERNKQVLYPVTKELLDRLNISNVFDLAFPRGSKFNAEGFIDYGGTENYNQYLAYTLDSTYGAESGEFGRSRFLKPSEQEKYKELFSEVIPEDLIDPTLFKYVDYCYYNCCEADDYYVKKDSFEEEIWLTKLKYYKYAFYDEDIKKKDKDAITYDVKLCAM